MDWREDDEPTRATQAARRTAFPDSNYCGSTHRFEADTTNRSAHSKTARDLPTQAACTAAIRTGLKPKNSGTAQTTARKRSKSDICVLAG